MEPTSTQQKTKINNPLSGFILFCSGVDVKFLGEHCPGEKNKFYPIGLGVIATASLAFIAMLFATHAIFFAKDWQDELLLAGFSLFWAFLIFTIDWGLIKTMKKSGLPIHTFRQGFLAVFPIVFRLAVAILISYSISRPLEARIYERPLKGQIESDRQAFTDLRDSLHRAETARNFAVKVDSINGIINSMHDVKNKGVQTASYQQLLGDKKACAAEFAVLSTSNNAEITRRRAILHNMWYDSTNHIDNKIRNHYNQEAQQRYTSIRSEISILNDAINDKAKQCGLISSQIRQDDSSFDTGLTQQIDGTKKVQDDYLKVLKEKRYLDSMARAAITRQSYIAYDTVHPGLITELAAMSNYEKTPEGRSAGGVRLILLILIISIDTAPIVIKLLTKRGIYEKMKESDHEMSEFLSDNETYANKHLIRQLSRAQKEVLTIAIDQWKEKEKSKTNLSEDYVNNN